MISKDLFEIIRCPECKDTVKREENYLYCEKCGDKFEYSSDQTFLDLRPKSITQRKSVYGDEEFVNQRGQIDPGPPFLSGGIKNWVLKSMVPFKKNDFVLDAGCGPGRYILWNLDSKANFVGLDQEPFFSDSITNDANLVRGYLHFIPFAESSFDTIMTLDVLEHMGLTDIRSFLKESARCLKKDGKLFIYTNSTESSALAPLIKFRQLITRFFAKRGMVDLKIEKESKEDHINAIKKLDQLLEIAKENNFTLVDSIYYNPVVMGWFENLLLKLIEHFWNKASKKSDTANKSTNRTSTKSAKQAMKTRTKKKGVYYFIFWMITQIMKLDILLFSNIKAGQFFLLFNCDKKD